MPEAMKNENGSEKRGCTQLPFWGSGLAPLFPQPEHCPPPQACVPGWGGGSWAEEALQGAPEEVGTGGGVPALPLSSDLRGAHARQKTGRRTGAGAGFSVPGAWLLLVH